MKDKKATGNNDVLEDALSFVERRWSEKNADSDQEQI
jgi:hypothetical protein